MAYPPPYSVTFAANYFSAIGSVDYTVPAGRVAIVSSISCVAGVGNVAAYLLGSCDPTGSGSFVIIYQASIPAGANANARGSGYWQGRVAVPAGGKIRAQCIAASTGYVTVSGYLLHV